MNNEEEYINSNIKSEADRIRKQILGSSLYGRMVNEDSVDELIVAAYYYGKNEKYYLEFRER
jgi:hypothetical protein